MYGLRTGGYEYATISANEDILPAIKAQEDAIFTTVKVTELRDISIVPTSGDCHIKINGGTPIFCKQDIGYSNDISVNTSFVVVENGTTFYMAYNYN